MSVQHRRETYCAFCNAIEQVSSDLSSKEEHATVEAIFDRLDRVQNLHRAYSRKRGRRRYD